jgi:L-asparaginase II
MRSSAKPIQALAAVETGAADRFAIGERELAVICASHGGEPFHVEAVQSILAKIGLTEDALGCGTHPPAYAPAAVALYCAGQLPSAVHNNCSGKHSGMLAATVAMGAPTARYLDPTHPVQQRILANVALFGGLDPAEIVVAVDGCSAPVFGLPISAMARMFATLASPAGLAAEKAAAARRVVAAMQAYPEMVGGTGRFDSELMAACGTQVVAKGGAEGVHCMGLPALGLGIAVKIEGGRGEAASVAAMEVLRGLGLLEGETGQRLTTHSRPEVHNVRGRVVGEMRPTFTYGR